MLTRITRYSLLVLCLLVVGVWGWSHYEMVEVTYLRETRLDLLLEVGDVIIIDGTPRNTRDPGFTVIRHPVMGRSYVGLSPPSFGFAGFRIDRIAQLRMTAIVIPCWMLFVLVLSMTAAVWYRHIRNRLRGKRDAGFEVEVRDDKVGG